MHSGNQNHIKTLTFTAITIGFVGIILYLAFHVVRPFFGIIATAGIFTIFLNPLFNKFELLTKKRRVAALLTFHFCFLLLSPRVF